MFVGHATLAFAVVAGVAHRRGWDANAALAVGLVAAAFATVPDVDITYALVGVVGRLAGAGTGVSALALAGAFWSTGSLVHRAVTHSLVLAPVVALLATLWALGTRRARAGALALAAGLVALAGLVSGPLGVVVTVPFVVVAGAVATVARRKTDLAPPTFFVTALFGLASHPFGDLFTGRPPAMCYPFDATLFAHRIALSPDPTVQLLGAFGIELAAIWAGVLVACAVAGVRPTVHLRPRASLGAGYAASVAVVPAPTLDLSYPFVFSVLAVGLLGLLPRLRLVGSRAVERPPWPSALTTGLAAVTVAWLAYAVAYLAL
ncbi:MAG: metal-dependent hydrolase [Haloplanus sp.]